VVPVKAVEKGKPAEEKKAEKERGAEEEKKEAKKPPAEEKKPEIEKSVSKGKVPPPIMAPPPASGKEKAGEKREELGSAFEKIRAQREQLIKAMKDMKGDVLGMRKLQS